MPKFCRPAFWGTLLLLVMHTPFCAISQIPSIVWQHCLGGADVENASCIQQTPDGGFIVSGASYSSDGNVAYNHGDGDGWMVKLDAGGSIAWQKNYGGTMFDNVKSIKVVSTGGYVFSGYTASGDVDIAGFHGLGDAWVAKIDTSGNLLWSKCFGGTHVELAAAIEETEDHGFIIAGYTQSADGDVSGYHGGVGKDFWVVKLDDTGAIQWEKTYGGTNNDIAYDITATIGGGYLVGGYTQSSDGDVLVNRGMADAWLLKIDDTGAIVWQKSYGGSNVDLVTSLRPTTDGNYIVACQTFSNDGDISMSHGLADVWLLKVNDTGGIIWNRTYGGSTDDNVGAIQVNGLGGYIFAGTTTSHDGDVVGMHDTTDCWVVKVDDTGNIEWSKCLGGSLFDYGSYIATCTDGSYAVAGTSNSTNGDVSGGNGIQDYWVVKLGYPAEVVDVATANLPKVYPTATNGTVFVELPSENENASITLMDNTSRLVETKISGGKIKTITIPAEQPQGLYLLRIQTGTYRATHRILVTR